MPRLYRVLCQLPVDTGLPQDVIVNTWHFDHDNFAPATTPADSANDMVDQLEQFYQAIDAEIFPSTMGSPMICKVYDLEQAEPRTPILTREVVITPNAAEPHPHEVAITLSLRAAAQSGVDPKRRRGRIFLGPIGTQATSVENSRVVVPALIRNVITGAALAAFRTGKLASDPILSVYSRTEDELGATTADAFHRVIEVSVDDALDTVRSRGHEPDVRTKVPFPGF